MIELYILIVFMIIAAIVAVETKDLLSSVIAISAVGLFLSLTFLVLKAPDLAMIQVVVEILCLIILIRATIRKDLPFSTSGRWLINTIITVIFIFVFLSISYLCLKDLPAFGFPIMKIAKIYIADGMSKTGATNLVTSIILDFRAYDALGEATLLFTAVIGVLTIMRQKGHKKIEEVDTDE